MVEQPSRQKTDLAEMVEMLLDKGVVVNADIVVSIGDTELLGVKVRAAIASFETAAEYGLEFPEGTDMDRVEAAAKGGRREGISEAEAPVTVTESSEAELDAAEARGTQRDEAEDEEDGGDGEDDWDEAEFLTEKSPVTAQTPASGQTPATKETPAASDDSADDESGEDGRDSDESAADPADVDPDAESVLVESDDEDGEQAAERTSRDDGDRDDR
ncbi:Gas vesicle protein [Halopelagius inordinatus]|uniref:Gas vesicle protein n=1 Tax=Halopelagius inordinatus TaxID=553467 RepID=A0A1I2T971_9EURY|nr:Gas vesicle protein [Halopelagius inordinatus]